MTNELLQPAIRQYRHNNEDSFVFGYDQKETDRVVAKLLAEVEQWKQVAEGAAVAATRTEACEIVEAALSVERRSNNDETNNKQSTQMAQDKQARCS